MNQSDYFKYSGVFQYGVRPDERDHAVKNTARKKRVVISGSIKGLNELERVAEKLRDLGFEVKAPSRSNYQLGNYVLRSKLIDEHLEFVKNADIFLIGNVKADGEKFGRIGTSTYFETGWAYALGKPLFALEKINPKSDFAEDLLSLNIEILSGDFKELKEEQK